MQKVIGQKYTERSGVLKTQLETQEKSWVNGKKLLTIFAKLLHHRCSTGLLIRMRNEKFRLAKMSEIKTLKENFRM